MVDIALDKHLIPDLASIVLEYAQLERVDEVVSGHRHVYTMLFGKKHGEDKYYYPTGELWWHKYYTNNKRHGESKEYYQTGQLEHSCHYVDGKQQGEYKEYFPTGELKVTWNSIDDEIHGECKVYLQNGDLELTEHYVNGVKQ